MQTRDFPASEAEVEEAVGRLLGAGGIQQPNAFDQFHFQISPEGVWSLLENVTGVGSMRDQATVSVIPLDATHSRLEIDVTSPAGKQLLGFVDLGNNKEEAETRFLDQVESLLRESQVDGHDHPVNGPAADS